MNELNEGYVRHLLDFKHQNKDELLLLSEMTHLGCRWKVRIKKGSTLTLLMSVIVQMVPNERQWKKPQGHLAKWTFNRNITTLHKLKLLWQQRCKAPKSFKQKISEIFNYLEYSRIKLSKAASVAQQRRKILN